MPGRLVFSTTQDGASNVTTALTIDSNQDMLPAGDIDFQQAAEISTTAGNITLNPSGNVSSTATIGPSVDSSFDLGIQTNGQWANLWADLVNGADYAYENGWRTLEAEKYIGYPKGIAFANTCFTVGKIRPTMPRGCRPVFVVTEEFIEFGGRRLFYSDATLTAQNAAHESPTPAPPTPAPPTPAPPTPAPPTPAPPPIPSGLPARLTKIGGVGLTATIPIVLTINDPVTGLFIRSLKLEVENVDLTTFASSTLAANVFLSTAFANASSTLGELSPSTRGTVIEDITVDLDTSNNLVSIDVVANVEVFTDSYSVRVRLELEGLNYTDFSPSSASISTILNSVKTNIINRFGE